MIKYFNFAINEFWVFRLINLLPGQQDIWNGACQFSILKVTFIRGGDNQAESAINDIGPRYFLNCKPKLQNLNTWPPNLKL